MDVVLASSLPDVYNTALAAHRSRPTIRKITGDAWQVPPGVPALFTYQSHWKNAPAAKPAGWPFDLQWIQVASAGVDTFPAWVYEVPVVTRAAGVHAPAIAEYVIGAVFAHEKRFWNARIAAPQHWQSITLGSVAGKTLGVAGLGEIGRECARLALALGMRVLGTTRTGQSVAGVEPVGSIEALLAASDHLVLALPLTPQTRMIINRDTLRHTRKGLHLINIARGAMIDDMALIEALDAGLLSGATLDVTHPEPPPAGHPFYTHPLIRMTPHVSGVVEDADDRMAAALVANLDAWLSGEALRGVVLPAVGY